MIKNDKIISEMMYGNILEKISSVYNIDINEAKEKMASLSFSEYYNLTESTADIVPPSGQQPMVNQPRKPIQPMQNNMQSNNQNGQSVPPQTGNPQGPVQPPQIDANGNPIDPTIDIQRLKELAGIEEDGSVGGISAGNIATSENTSRLKKEYVRRSPVKTIIGDTKPNQASGELSANLAASGKPAAGRTNNGFKK